MGCGCLALLAGAVALVLFFIYASTDPGPPVEQALLLASIAPIIWSVRALGVLGDRTVAG